MTALEFRIFTYLLNSLWQVPLVFAAAWIAARLARRAGPRMEHRVWVCALWLQVALPLCSFRLEDLWRQMWNLLGGSAPGGETRIIFGPAVASTSALLRIHPVMLTVVVAAYACGLLYFAGRLLWALWRTEAMRRHAADVSLTDEAAEKLEPGVRVAVSPMIAGPVTVGIRSGTLLLPPEFLNKVSAADLDAVFAHELAHLRRRDFAKNLLYELVSLPVAFYPLVWLTRSRLAETREMVCDAMAAEAVEGRERYARSLLRLASMISSPAPARTLHAMGIFDADVFERRIMNLTRKHFEARGMWRLGIAVICGAIALATCASALAFRMDVGAGKQPSKLHVSADAMQGNLIHKVPPVYPALAKKAKVQGSVVIDAVIGKDGAPENLKVESGHPLLQQSAMDAVKEWRWKPYLLNGDPVEVETTITVVYTLAK